MPTAKAKPQANTHQPNAKAKVKAKAMPKALKAKAKAMPKALKAKAKAMPKALKAKAKAMPKALKEKLKQSQKQAKAAQEAILKEEAFETGRLLGQWAGEWMGLIANERRRRRFDDDASSGVSEEACIHYTLSLRHHHSIFTPARVMFLLSQWSRLVQFVPIGERWTPEMRQSRMQ